MITIHRVILFFIILPIVDFRKRYTVSDNFHGKIIALLHESIDGCVRKINQPLRCQAVSS